MNATWKSIRVFISSTFRDMHAERDHLVRFVFPRLRQELSKRRIRLVDVDLRWGITSEQNVLEACRETIDECRPRFICMLGDRYGWVPRGQERSITADEIHYAVLDRLGQHSYAYFYFRDPKVSDSIPFEAACSGGYREYPQPDEIQKFGLKQAEQLSQRRRDRLHELKERIRDAGLKPFVYSAQWDDRQQQLVGLDARNGFGERVYADLISSIDAEFGTKPREPLDEFAEEKAEIDGFIQDRIERYVVGTRQVVLNELDRFADGNGEPNILVITGEPGSGKSALLCKFVQEYSAARPNTLIVPHFVGASTHSTSVRRMLRRLCREFGADTASLRHDTYELSQQFLHCLQEASESRRGVLVIDALNQLDATDDAHTLDWLPQQLPPNLRVIVSSLEHGVLQELRNRNERVRELRLDPLAPADAQALVKHVLRRYRKQMSIRQIELLLTKPDSRNPLYLLAALEELRTMGSFEDVTTRIGELPGGITNLFQWILTDRLSNDPGFRNAEGTPIGAELVRRFVSLIGVSRHGLSHTELVGVIAPGDPQGNVAALQRLLRPYLMPRGELLDFYHGQFREAVQSHYLERESSRREAHRLLAGYFQGQLNLPDKRPWSGKDPHAISELPYHLAGAGQEDALSSALTELGFLEAKTEAGMIAELIQDFDLARTLPERHAGPDVLRLIREALKRDANFLAEHPQCVFQQLWNRCWWYDCPGADDHYELEPGQTRPCQHAGPKAYSLAERWRREKNKRSAGGYWLRCCRPLPGRLGEADVLEGHADAVTSVAFCPDGFTIVSGSQDRTVRLWNAVNGRSRVLFQHPGSGVTSVAVSPDGGMIASGFKDGTVRVWEPRTGQQRAVPRGSGQQVTCVEFSPDGRTLAIASRNQTVLLWDVATGQERAKLQGGEGDFWSVSFSEDGRRIATAGYELRVWDAASGRAACVCRPFFTSGMAKYPITSIAFSPDGQTIASDSASGSTVWLWEPSSGEQKAVLKGHSKRVNCVAYSSDGQRIVSGSDDRTVRLWNADTGENTVFEGHLSGIKGVGFSPDGRTIVSSAADRTLRLWESPRGQGSMLLQGHSDRCYYLTVSADGGTVASSSNTVRLWDVGTGRQKGFLKGHVYPVGSIAFSPGGGTIATAAGDNSMRLWEGTSGRQTSQMTTDTWGIESMAFSPDGRMIASGSRDKTIRLWNSARGRQKAVLHGHTRTVCSVAFSFDGQMLASGSEDSTVRLWDMRPATVWRRLSRQSKLVLKGHMGPVRCVAFSPDGQSIVSGSDDRTVRLWDAKTGLEQRALHGHHDSVQLVAFSLDARTITSVSRDGTVCLWSAAGEKQCKNVLPSSDVQAAGQRHIHDDPRVPSGVETQGIVKVRRMCRSPEDVAWFPAQPSRIITSIPSLDRDVVTSDRMLMVAAPDGRTIVLAEDRHVIVLKLEEFGDAE